MMTKEEVLKNNEYENEILELIYNQDQFTRSDLQGIVSGIVLKIIRETREEVKK